jgi:hypothetical protein
MHFYTIRTKAVWIAFDFSAVAYAVPIRFRSYNSYYRNCEILLKSRNFSHFFIFKQAIFVKICSSSTFCIADFYEFEYTEMPLTPTPNWIQKTCTKRRLLLEGLISGKQYAFRVAGAGSDPSRIYSEILPVTYCSAPLSHSYLPLKPSTPCRVDGFFIH